ncbi:MAG: hypothetical protein AAFX44_15625 [Pseudomonadota bacterium]
MAGLSKATTFSEHFRVGPDELERLGVFDPVLGIDTKLFIDPLLLEQSAHKEINTDAVQQYVAHFELVLTFLAETEEVGDVAWRSARNLLRAPEIKGTCLGYGSDSIHGSAVGPKLAQQITAVGREVVSLGIRNPVLFPAMALFEENIGPDLISDVTTNVIRQALADFNRRILTELGLEGETMRIADIDGLFMPNPLEERETPIILVPTDILRELPIASDWDSVATASAYSEEVREKVNQQIGHIFAKKNDRSKDELKAEATAQREAFETLIDAIDHVPRDPYDLSSDPAGHTAWQKQGKLFASIYPLALVDPPKTAEGLKSVVLQIVERFRDHIENRGLSKVLYDDKGNPRHEWVAQQLFFVIADEYCRANDIDVSPETDKGRGPVDFKFSRGYHNKVLVEIKLSTNSKVPAGYTKQLEIYKASEETVHAVYLVIDVGRMGRKQEKLTDIRNSAEGPLSDLEFVDAIPKPSASKA